MTMSILPTGAPGTQYNGCQPMLNHQAARPSQRALAPALPPVAPPATTPVQPFAPPSAPFPPSLARPPMLSDEEARRYGLWVPEPRKRRGRPRKNKPEEEEKPLFQDARPGSSSCRIPTAHVTTEPPTKNRTFNNQDGPYEPVNEVDTVDTSASGPSPSAIDSAVLAALTSYPVMMPCEKFDFSDWIQWPSTP